VCFNLVLSWRLKCRLRSDYAYFCTNYPRRIGKTCYLLPATCYLLPATCYPHNRRRRLLGNVTKFLTEGKMSHPRRQRSSSTLLSWRVRAYTIDFNLLSCSSILRMMMMMMTIIIIIIIITPRSRILPVKPTDPQPVEKFPPFYGTRSSINSFTRARHFSVYRTRSVNKPVLCSTK
jgi:hypothetical protein